jgi:putative transposase
MLPMSSDIPDLHRRSIRLREYDYAQAGGYFVTICTQGHKCIFGEVRDAEMRLNNVGSIVEDEWRRTIDVRAEIVLDAFVVMPNHLHGIVFTLEHARRDGGNVAPRTMRGTGHRSLSGFVAGFKAATTRRVNALRMVRASLLWQRNYYEHIIRSEADLDRIRQYVADNPARWGEDGYHPSKVGRGASGVERGRAPLAPTNPWIWFESMYLSGSCDWGVGCCSR